MVESKNELAVVEGDLLSPAPLTGVQQALAGIREFVAKELKLGVDFGLIPGAAKPSLWKSGAEKLAMLLGVVSDFPESTWPIDDAVNLRFVAEVRCVLTHYATGRFAGARRATAGADAYTRWGERAAERLAAGPKLADIIWTRNQALAMAQKRAFVAAMVGLSRLAADFTTDLEDAPDAVESRAAWRPKPASAAPAAPAAPADEGPPTDWTGICGVCNAAATWYPSGISKKSGKPYRGYGRCQAEDCRAVWNHGRGWELPRPK